MESFEREQQEWGCSTKAGNPGAKGDHSWVGAVSWPARAQSHSAKLGERNRGGDGDHYRNEK